MRLEYRVVEFDLERYLEPVKWFKPRDLVTILDLDRTLDSYKPLGRILLFNTRGLDQENKRPGAAIHYGYFRRTQIHKGVVYPQPCQRRQQVLDCRNAGRAADQGRGQTRFTHVFGTGLDLYRRIKINPAKNNAGIRGGRSQGQVDLLTRVQAHTCRTDDIFERTLPDHGVIACVAALLHQKSRGDVSTALISCLGSARHSAHNIVSFPS